MKTSINLKRVLHVIIVVTVNHKFYRYYKKHCQEH